MLEAHDTDEEIDQMHELFSSIFDEEYPPEDMSAAEWLKQKVGAPVAWPVNMCGRPLGQDVGNVLIRLTFATGSDAQDVGGS
jgi:hypothetical protein